MLNDKRKARRRPLRYTAWLALKAGQLHGCALSDMSDSGARIEVEDSKIIPDRFVLLLSGNGKARRKCRVVWREERQVGVTFERPLANSERATLVPRLDADMVAAATPVESAETD